MKKLGNDLEKYFKNSTYWLALKRVFLKWWVVIIGGLLFGGLLATDGVLWLHSRSDTQAQPIVIQEPEPTPTPEPQPQGFGVLLLGYGGADHDGGALTDSIGVAYVLPQQKTIWLLSLPRDLWVEIPATDQQPAQFAKLNYVFPFGNQVAYQQADQPGLLLAKEVVSQITGIEVKHAAAVNFASFAAAIDTLGGVKVEVPQGFTDEFYPIKGEENNSCDKSDEEIAALSATMSGFKLEQQFPCRFETISFATGTMVMDGATALKFVRSRHSPGAGNDFSRSQRQQALLQGLQQKFISLDAVTKLPQLYQQFQRYVQTDLTLLDLTNLLPLLGNPAEYQLKTLRLSDDNILEQARSRDGQFISQPKSAPFDWQRVQWFIEFSINSM